MKPYCNNCVYKNNTSSYCRNELDCKEMGGELNAFVEDVYNAESRNPSKPEQHMAICKELNALYTRKNHDYGDSFHQSFLEEGMAMARIRLGDKLNRFKSLTKKEKQEVKDESVRDTLIDLANYAIMTVMEMDGDKDGAKTD